ncbi:MAG TPA: membrane dipeptidase [Hyphomicrobiaceae bacterium]|nr:membrane dipeptidase [Hyphomicrobiaceae bacterium]
MTQILVDAHLDLAYNAVVLGRDLLRPVAEIRTHETEVPPPGVPAGVCLTSLPALLDGRVAIAGASIFVAPAFKSWQQEPQVYRTPDEAYRYAVLQLDYYRRLADENARVTILGVVTDLNSVLASWKTDQPQLGLFIVMEGADPLREPGDVGWWVERGLRGIGLSWSAGTRYAGGNAAPGPLTDDGRVLLSAMADYNLLLDLSHLWEEAAYEALDRYPGPIAATHANPRAFADSPRQLPDALIRRIAAHEGVVGVVPFNRMLDAAWRSGEARLPLERVVEVIDHICQVTGAASFVGLGSDFDGGFGRESVPEGLDSIADLGKLGSLLAERGYTASDVAAILSENWLRVMRRVLEGI